MPSEGPNLVGTGSSDSSNGGNVAWTSPTKIEADDADPAVYTVTAVRPSIDYSEYIKGLNPGFSVPTNATITGIEVVVDWLASSGDGTDTQISSSGPQPSGTTLVKAGSVAGTRNSSYGNPMGGGVATIGGSTDMWGTTWTPAQVNAANFGAVVALRASIAGGTRNFRLDSMKITVYFTEAVTITGVTGTASAAGLAGVATSIGVVSVAGEAGTSPAAGLLGVVTSVQPATVTGALGTATAEGLPGEVNQQAVPDADTAVGNWTSTGANLFSVLDELFGDDDADFVTIANVEGDEEARLSMSVLNEPFSDNVYVKVRARQT